MAEKIFVIYQTNAGTAIARPVLEYYTEDASHVPSLSLLGYSAATTGWVALDSFEVPETPDPTTRSALFVDPTAATTSTTDVARYDVTYDQTQILARIADLIAQWNWTQELDAKITRATQAAFATWIEQLEAIPSNPLWATNPRGIALPAVPAVVASPATVAQQVASADWTDDAVMASQKLSVANPGTLQAVWGFDTDDLRVFGSHARITLGWTVGRSGHRALLATASAGAVQTVWVTPGVAYSFAMAPGDTFYLEAWVRGSLDMVVNLGLVGFDRKSGQAISYDGGDGRGFVTARPDLWQRVSGYVQVPSGNPIRWGSAEFTFQAGASSVWIEIDALTITRVPRLPNTYSQAIDTVPIVYTGSDFTQADVVLGLSFFRGGNGATVKLSTMLRIVPANTSSDQMRLQFWLARQIFGSPTPEVMTTWLEYGSGANQHRNTGMEWTDAVADNKRVDYTLRASRLGSINAMSVAHRSMSALLLPRL